MATEFDVEGLGTIASVARRLSREASREWRAEIRRAGEPIVRDAKSRFRRLGGSKAATTARTVRLRATPRGVQLQMGGRNHPWARPKEFGAKRQQTRRHRITEAFGRPIDPVVVVKRIDYSSPRIFGPSSGQEGKAFFPAVREGRELLERRLVGLRDNFVEVLSRGSR